MDHIITQYFETCTPSIILAVDLITGIYRSKKVSSSVLAMHVSGAASVSSKQRRIERMYRNNYVEKSFLLDAIQKMFGNGSFILSLDRTNWKFGKKSINALGAFATRGDIGSLIDIKMLDNKGGNSNSDTRIEMVAQVVERYGKDSIESILGDREFFSFDFAIWLDKQDLPYAIRVKENLQFVQPYLKRPTAEGKTYKNIEITDNDGTKIKCDLSIKKLKDEYLIIASRKVANPLEIYRKRWSIERFFKMLKTGGFNLEDSKLTHPNRMETLFLLCSIAYLLCVKTGVYRHNNVTKMRYKKRDNCYEYSYFRWGLNWLQEMIAMGNDNLNSIIDQMFNNITI